MKDAATALKLKYNIGEPLTFEQAEEICRLDDLCILLTDSVKVLLRRAEAAEEELRIRSVQQPRCMDVKDYEKIRDRAIEVLGDYDKALRWMEMQIKGLDYHTPIELALTKEGTQLVMDALGRIESGVW